MRRGARRRRRRGRQRLRNIVTLSGSPSHRRMTAGQRSVVTPDSWQIQRVSLMPLSRQLGTRCMCNIRVTC